MKAFTERRSLRMGCGESLRHRPVRVFALDDPRTEASPGIDVERLSWANAPEAPVPDPRDEGNPE